MYPEIKTSVNGNGAGAHAHKQNAASKPNLTAIVKGKDEKFTAWSENSEVTSLSSSGAGIFIPVPCPVGCIVSLMLPMPAEMRRYDLDKRLYRVWGLVQYCHAAVNGPAGYHVGVALIGKDAPESYAKNPMQSYRVCGMRKSGLWKIEELDNSFKQRTSARYWNSIEGLIVLLDDAMKSREQENVVTENISESGAAVFSELRVAVGDRIKFQTHSPLFSSLSVVRDRRIGVDDRMRIHLEFVENPYPILEIKEKRGTKG
jgi:hypothetical protein